MFYTIKFFYKPEGENEGGNTLPDKEEVKKDSTDTIPESDAVHKDHKTVLEKIKDALQDWSDKDEQDQQFDDTRV